MPALVPSVSLPAADPIRREVPVFLFAYANDRREQRFLRNLAEERRRIKHALQGASDQGRCRLVECSGATLSEVLDECQRHAHGLTLLHFAGHADAMSLLFETATGEGHPVSAKSFTEFLGGFKGLRLVFLNGCSTRAQVDALLDQGVRSVVATSTPVSDQVAMEMAERFYKAVEGGAVIEDAFRQATGAVSAQFGEHCFTNESPCTARGSEREIEQTWYAGAETPWELLGEPAALAHQLIDTRPSDSAKCLVVITATLEQFDADTIARVTAELQKVSGDLSLRISKIESGSVRLTLSLSEEGRQRLLEAWSRGSLPELAGFELVTIGPIDTDGEACSLSLSDIETRAGIECGGRSANDMPMLAADVDLSNLMVVDARYETRKINSRRSRRGSSYLVGGMAAVVTMCAALFLHHCKPVEQRCQNIAPGRWRLSFQQCFAEYATTRDSSAGLATMRAAYYLEEYDSMERIASSLGSGPHAGDAGAWLGLAARARGNWSAAHQYFEHAMYLHEQDGDLDALSRDAYQLTTLYLQQGEPEQALLVLGRMRSVVAMTADVKMSVYLDLAAADAYRELGDRWTAESSARMALENARGVAESLSARFRIAVLRLEMGLLALARADFERMARDGEGLKEPFQSRFLRVVGLYLAVIDCKQGLYGGAIEWLESNRAHLDESMFRLVRGMALRGQGRLAEARADLHSGELAAALYPGRWWFAYQTAMMESEVGNVESAIAASLRAIEQVSHLVTRSVPYGSAQVSTLRQPHLHLVGLYARRAEWLRAFDLVIALDAQRLLDSYEQPTFVPELLAPAPEAPEMQELVEFSDITQRIPSMASWSASHSRSGVDARPIVATSSVLEAWRDRFLVVIVPGGGRAWRLVLRDGVLTGRDLGDVQKLEELATTLMDSPNDVVAGRALGELWLGDLSSDRVIDLLVIGKLAHAPLAALRVGEESASSIYRIARVPGVLPRRSASNGQARTRAVVIGDASGDLPGAAGEAIRLGTALGVRPLLGKQATRSALLHAGSTDLLHISLHGDGRRDENVLRLADGEVTASELARVSSSARYVVLTACDVPSAGPRGSLSEAFLSAGAEYVIAPRWTVSDREAARFIAAFYDSGGASDPVGALGLARRDMFSTLSSHGWAAFEAFSNRPPLP